jgi:hypothetical protein
MATELYFDTARLGRMCRSACSAERDFTKLASQLGSSLYWERFLVEGFNSLPDSLRRRCSALSCWDGLASFQQGLADFVSLPSNGAVLFAGQSRTLMTLAAECLFQRCQRVFATDLEWPPYLAILKLAAVRHGKTLRVLPLRHAVLTANCHRQELTKRVVADVLHHDCDGLFLSDITHTGVKIPYQQVLDDMTRLRHPCFTVIDGAQALGQHPVMLNHGKVDLYLTGTQKWFGAYHPLRVAFIGPQSTWVTPLMQRLLDRRQLSDPLGEFCLAVLNSNWRRLGETVNLSALMTASGALAGWMQSQRSVASRWINRRMNRRLVLDTLLPLAHSAVHDSLSGGIALLRIDGVMNMAGSSYASLREALAHEGIVASEPLRGMIRLAMPSVPLSPAKLAQLRRGLTRVVGPRSTLEAHPCKLRKS